MRPILVAILGSFLLSGCSLMLHEVEQSTAATLLPRLSADEAAAVPEGAHVEIDRRFTNAETRATTTGIVLKSSAEGLALANCTVVGRSIHGTPIISKIPRVSRLFKNTGVGTETLPVLWLPLDQISSVHILEPPPADYVAPSIEINTVPPQPIGVDFDYETSETGVSGQLPQLVE